MLCADLRMSGEKCLNFNWHSSRAAPGISFFRVPTKDDRYSIKAGETNVVKCCSYFDNIQ